MSSAARPRRKERGGGGSESKVNRESAQEEGAEDGGRGRSTSTTGKRKEREDGAAVKKVKKRRKPENDDGFEFKVVRRRSQRISERFSQVITKEPKPQKPIAQESPILNGNRSPPLPPEKKQGRTVKKRLEFSDDEEPVAAPPPEKPVSRTVRRQLEFSDDEVPAPPPKPKKKKVLVKKRVPRDQARKPTARQKSSPQPVSSSPPPPPPSPKRVARERSAERASPSPPRQAPTKAKRVPTNHAEKDASAATDSTSKIKLPTSDTPINRKNQKYRQSVAGGRRRSSVGMRGRRASSMMSEGIVAEPHAEISHKDFYKHIQDDQMENMRMRQLLSWCAFRALGSLHGNSQPKPANDLEVSACNIARVIEEELLQEITSNGQLSTWFTRDSSPAPTVVKKPNPRNQENEAKIEKLKAELQKLEDEKESWRQLQKLEPSLSLLPRDANSDTTPAPTTLLPDPEEETFSEIADSLSRSQDSIGTARRSIKQQGGDIEFQVDRLADGVHKLQQYGDAADRLAGQILEGCETSLATSETKLKEASGTDGLPLHEVLRSLSRVGTL